MKVKVELYQREIKELQKAIDITGLDAAIVLKKEITDSKTIPKDEGELESSGAVKRIRAGRYQIVYSTPYAVRLYWHPEYKFRRDKNSNAGGLWLHPYIDGEKKDSYKNIYSRFLKKNAKGLIK